MDMLCEMDRIRRKYGLSYYSDSGTLSRVIRYKEYIPWDDDIDIVMMCSEYQKIQRVVCIALKAPYTCRVYTLIGNSTRSGYDMEFFYDSN